MARSKYSATVIVKVAVEVNLKANNFADAASEAEALKPGDILSVKGGSFNDWEPTKVASIQSDEWL